jgi:hypothetical protein
LRPVEADGHAADALIEVTNYGIKPVIGFDLEHRAPPSKNVQQMGRARLEISPLISALGGQEGLGRA